MDVSPEERQTLIDALTQVFTDNGAAPEDASTAAEGLVDETIQRGDS